MNLKEKFEQFNDDHSKFEQVENKLSTRADLHAFILLNMLVPATTNMISATNHNEIYLNVDMQKFAQVATEQQIHDLVRCGISYDSEYEFLTKFV